MQIVASEAPESIPNPEGDEAADRETTCFRKTLLLLVFRANYIPGKISRSFPIQDEPWRLEGRPVIPTLLDAVTEVWEAMTELEMVLNPGDLTFGDPNRLAPFFGTTDTPSLSKRARDPKDEATARISSDSAVEANNVIYLFDKIVEHYGWENVICHQPDWDSPPWEFGNPPPISVKMLADFRNAVDRLIRSLDREDAKLSLRSFKAAGGRQRPPQKPDSDGDDGNSTKSPDAKADENRTLSDAKLFPKGHSDLPQQAVEAARRIAMADEGEVDRFAIYIEVAGSRSKARALKSKVNRLIRDNYIDLLPAKNGRPKTRVKRT